MKIRIFRSTNELGQAAAAHAAEELNAAIKRNGGARLLLSTGASQFETLEALRGSSVDWSKVEMFHLDEYVGLPETHKASFIKYLKERFVDGLPLKKAHFVDGNRPQETIRLLTEEIRRSPVDVGLIGIGENGHIAFNDPPADFETKEAFKIVTLDERCKAQQVREGWFATIHDVPDQAVSMTVHQIMQCRVIISAVPHRVKAEAVKATIERELTNEVPATMLKQHPDFTLYLDEQSSALLDKETINQYAQ